MHGARRSGSTKLKRALPSTGARRGPPRRKRPLGRLRKRFGRLSRAVARYLRRPATRRLLRAGLLASLWGAILCGAVLIFFLARMPDLSLATLDARPPNVTVLAADGTVLAERGLRRGHVRLDALPPHLVEAVLATEDRRFYRHPGIDPLGLLRAGVRNVRAGAVVEGGSTITQQLAKNLFLKPERTVTRKLEELVYAMRLEGRFTKDELLELYLNRVYFGGGAYGVEAASRHYFGKPARALTLPQSAMLAGLLKAPSRYTPGRNVKLAKDRVGQVLDRMADAGFLTETEARAAAKQPLGLAAKGDETGYPYAVDWVAELLPEFVGEHGGDLLVHTTVDAGLQRAAQKALRRLLDEQGQKHAADEGAVVVLDPSGGVKAVVGGRSYRVSPFDRAIKALRQPGSAFKPFVYLAALESGYSPNSRAYDAPVTIAGWSPRNYTGTYRGEVTLREGMAHSLNTVAARLAAEVGPGRVAHTAQRLGIQSKLHQSPSLALGTAEVTLLELTAAYAPFANGGQGVMPHVITRVRTSDGKVLYARRHRSTGQVVAPAHVGPMNDMLNAALMRGTGKRAAIPGHVAAGKTGTTQGSRDAWFVGYTAHYVTGVWIGNDDNARMRKVTGGTLPAELWHDVMLHAHADKTPLMLPGTRGPYPNDMIARLPWNASGGKPAGLFRRVLGFFGG
jgi:penicillin-binding protein 1A